MSAVLRTVLVTFWFSVCVSAQIRVLTVYEASARHIDSATVHELRGEVQRLLRPAAMQVSWRHAGERSVAEESDKLAVVWFEGDCSALEMPSPSSASRLAGVFADTSVDKDGQVQPFFRVNCTRIIRNLWPTLSRMGVPMRRVLIGRAIGRVMAHEIYHIVGQTTVHAEAGVAKLALSSDDLVAERFQFDATSLERMRPVRTFLDIAN